MASLTFRVDDRLKQRFDKLVGQLGLNRSHVLRDAIADKLTELESLVGTKPRQQTVARPSVTPEEAVLQQVRRFPEIEQAILFGSRAQGDAGPTSDVDIALSCPGISAQHWVAIATGIEDADTLVDVDVIWLEQAQPSLRDEIQQTGKVIYVRP